MASDTVNYSDFRKGDDELGNHIYMLSLNQFYYLEAVSAGSQGPQWAVEPVGKVRYGIFACRVEIRCY
jgi:hypothetical protein